MELYQLQYFEVLCKYKSYTLAARELNVTQPAISIAMRKLEKEYGAPLFDKNSKDFKLTTIGELFLEEGKKVLNALENLNQKITEGIHSRRESLHIAFPVSLCDDLMVDMQVKLMEKFPKMEIIISNIPARDVAEGLTKGTLDLGALCKEELNPALESAYFRSIEFCAFMSSKHKLSVPNELTPEMLSGEKILVLGLDRSVSLEIKRYFNNYGVNVEWGNVGYILPYFLPYLAGHGNGIAFAAESLKDSQMFYDSNYNSFAVRHIQPPIRIDLFMAWHGGKILTSTQKAVLNFIIAQYGDRMRDK